MKICKYETSDFTQNVKKSFRNQTIEDYFLYLRLTNLKHKALITRSKFGYITKIDYRGKFKSLLSDLIERNGMGGSPRFRIPTEYNYGSRYFEKIYIPVDEHPDINFIGYLLGPSGKSLQQLEHDLGVKISIRGQGAFNDDSGEKLHCLVTSDTEINFKRGVREVENIIKSAIDLPENENELKMMQLKELGYFNKERNFGKLTDWEKYFYWWYFFNKVEK
ncbi:Branchpoint-bridging protein [Dictyocoela roeselum]|nr:Branchpoint-bridging protein [Dictyocoela roeselum]